MSQEGQTITTMAPKAVEKGLKPEGWSYTVVDPFLGDFDDLANRFGKEVVEECARAQMRIKFQAAVRGMAERGASDEEITRAMSSWKPGDKLGVGADPQKAILKNFGNLTPEQRATLIAQLKDMQEKG